jgi:hypothetical protein
MRRPMLLGIAVGAVIVLGSAGGAFAGERGGDGHETPAGDKARSLCAYSGLDDMDFEEDVDPGTVQNWGHIPRDARKMFSDRGAAVVELPWGEEGCNASMFPNKEVPNH